MSFKERSDFLWKTIGRFDIYYNSVNAKASVLIAFNVFIVTGLAVKWNDFASWFPQPWARTIAGASLLVAVASSIFSLWKTFATVFPFLNSHKKPVEYHSSMFFNHVAEYEKPEDFLEVTKKLNEETAIQDLSYQAHSLACGLKCKFKNLKMAIGAILFVQIPALTVFFVLRAVLSLISSFKFV